MSVYSPRLQLKVAQKQILTPSLLQMVTVLQLNRMELKDLINQELVENPVLEDRAEDGGEEITPEELVPLLEGERNENPDEKGILVDSISTGAEVSLNPNLYEEAAEGEPSAPLDDPPAAPDPFDEIDFGPTFEEWLGPGHKTPASESVEKPSFETFLSSPVTLCDYLRSQLSILVIPEEIRDATETVIGNLEEDGYLSLPLEELAEQGGHKQEDVEAALKVMQSLDPAGIAARDLRECLLLQLESRNARGGVAWQIVQSHLKLLQTNQFKEMAKLLGRPLDHIEIAVSVIRHLNPVPGLRYAGPGARLIEPDVYIDKDGDGYRVRLNDDDLPQLRLNAQYRRMLDRENGATKEERNYVKERYSSAVQLIKNIQQRQHTIVSVCEAIVRRQLEFLAFGIDYLKPMMIKEVAEEIGVHSSTVSRAVAGKYVHTSQGVFELRYFFSEAVQGPSGSNTPLLLLKRKVKKMIEDEDRGHPLTDDRITDLLRAAGINVTRRTVAKYRDDMKIPSTHQRRTRG
ncbi:MAG: RNA polymerase factor sigma-54 [Bryobacteraceae bacterium]